MSYGWRGFNWSGRHGIFLRIVSHCFVYPFADIVTDPITNDLLVSFVIKVIVPFSQRMENITTFFLSGRMN